MTNSTELINAGHSFTFGPLMQAGITILIGAAIARLAGLAVFHVFEKMGKSLFGQLWRKVVYYLVLIIFVLMAVHNLGFDLHILLGAAGIVTVAMGFASQTTASNLISGLFLIGEHPFSVGETIAINDVQGEIISVDFLSTKLRTSDNTLVRIPNEILFKTQFTNLSRLPIRRFACILTLAYKQDLAKIKKLLLENAHKNPLCLREPEPDVLIQNLSSDGVHLQLNVWAIQKDYSDMKDSLLQEINRSFAENNIEVSVLPYDIYAQGKKVSKS